MMHPVYAKSGQRIEAERAESSREAVLIKSARTIVKQGGDCAGPEWVDCGDCPFHYTECGNTATGLSLARAYLSEHTDPEALTTAQEIAAIAAPYMPHDKWVELYEAIEKALEARA